MKHATKQEKRLTRRVKAYDVARTSSGPKIASAFRKPGSQNKNKK